MIAVSDRRKKQRGNTVLDSALCFLPMMAMFFGVIDVCYAVSIQSLLAQAVRAGARFAVTYSGTYNGTNCGTVAGTGSQASCITQVVQDNAVGFLAGSKSNYVVVNYYIANSLTTPAMTCNAGTCTASGTPALPYTYTASTVTGNTTGTTSVTINYANQPGNVVEVTIPSFPMLWMVPIVGTPGYTFSAGSQVTDSSGKKGLGLTLSASAVDVLGGLQQGTTIPPNP
jgi:Flp pilus assembly protein TadG